MGSLKFANVCNKEVTASLPSYGQEIRMSKDNRVYMRFDDDEIKTLEEKAQGKPLASFCREVALDIRVRKKKRQTQFSDYPPEIIRELSAIGNNLNQITRLAHQAKKDSALDLLVLIDAVNVIREQTKRIVDDCKNVQQS